MRSLLSICQAVAGDAGFGVPSSIIGNTDQTATRLLRLANKSGRAMSKKPWEVLQKEFTFSTVASTATYAFPSSDFGWFVNDTAWDRSNYWKMRGSLSAQEWQRYKSGIASTQPRTRFRIKGGLIYIDPTPTAVVNMVIEYISSKWCSDSTGATPKLEFDNDQDVPLFDDYLFELDLTWRFLDRQGMSYGEAKDEAERQIDIAFAHDIPKEEVNLASRKEPWPPLPTVPITGYS